MTTAIAPTRPRPIGVGLLVAAQAVVVGAYLGGTLIPYLWYFVLGDRPLFAPERPNIAPSEILPAWLGPLVIAAYIVTGLSVYLLGPLALAGVIGYAGGRRNLRARVWLGVFTAATVALLVFQFTPLGGDLAVWVAD
jgi:hypothetical protein